jgi:adiponectin receptor
MIHALSFPWLATMGALYIIGALIYGTRIPERWMPGKFDLFFHSHQIFHVLVVMAAMSHYWAVIQTFQWQHQNNPFCHQDITEISKLD